MTDTARDERSGKGREERLALGRAEGCEDAAGFDIMDARREYFSVVGQFFRSIEYVQGLCFSYT